MKSKWQEFFFILAVIACHLVFAGMQIDDRVGGDDTSGYLHQAKALRMGEVESYLRQNSKIVHAAFENTGPIAYSWGYPLLLASTDLIDPQNHRLNKYLSLIVFLLGLIAFTGICKRFLKSCYWFPPLALALTPAIVKASNLILSDYVFVAVCLICFWAYDLLRFKDTQKFISLYWYCLAVLILGLIPWAFRLNGVFVLFSLVLAETVRVFPLWRTRGKWMQNFLPIILSAVSAYAIYLIWIHLLPLGGQLPYNRTDSFTPLNLVSSFKYYSSIIWIIWLLPEKLALVLVGLSFPVVLIGSWRLRATPALPLLFFFFGTLLFFGMLNLHGGIRYFYCILPFYYLFIAKGLEAWPNKIFERISSCICIALVSLFFLTLVEQYAASTTNIKSATAHSAATSDLFAYILKNVGTEETISYRDPRSIYLYTNRLAFASVNDERINEADIKIFTTNEPKRELYRDKLEVLFENDSYVVFGPEIKK